MMLNLGILIPSQAMLDNFWIFFSWSWVLNCDRNSASSRSENSTEISLKDLLDLSEGNSDFDEKIISFSFLSFSWNEEENSLLNQNVL